MSGGSPIERYLSARYRGNGGHECRPAGRGTVEPNWTCPTCEARWKRIDLGKVVQALTWERADLG